MLQGAVSVRRSVLPSKQRVVKILRGSTVHPILSQLGLGLVVLVRQSNQCHRHCNEQHYEDNLGGVGSVFAAGQCAAVGGVAVDGLSRRCCFWNF